jgi:uncharacterized protein (DUF302 family)
MQNTYRALRVTRPGLLEMVEREVTAPSNKQLTDRRGAGRVGPTNRIFDVVTRRRPHFVFIALAFAPLLFVLVGSVFQNQPAWSAHRGNPMDITRITVEHVRVAANQPFEKVTKAFEEQTGRFDPAAYQQLNAGADPDEVRAKIKAMEGPSGFMLFRTSDHGALLRLAGEKRKALQYLVGNPLFALQMTQHDIRASLYAPLRVVIYENEQGKTCVEYDRPSSLFGQFGNTKVTEVARMLDRKLEQLVAKAIQ